MLDEWAALDGRVAIVTGGAGGLGRAVTLDLARAGVNVAVCDRDQAAAREVVDLLAPSGGEPVVSVFDVRDPERLAEFFEQVDGRLGPVGVLVNVPGGGFYAPALEVSARGADALIRQNFSYVWESCRLAARRMMGIGGGSIVNVTSVEAHRAMPNMAIYGAMKAAVEHLSRTLAVEWGPHRIRVNTVAPDWFPTPATEALTDDDPDQRAANAAITVPLGRVGTGRDFSGCVLFLASDLSAYVTGTTVHVDGGTRAAGGWLRWPDAYRCVVPPYVLDRLDAAPPEPSG